MSSENETSNEQNELIAMARESVSSEENLTLARGQTNRCYSGKRHLY